MEMPKKKDIYKIIADGITSLSNNSSKNDEANNEMEIPKKDIYLQKKRQQIIGELRLVQ